jgi:hypothetical protein
MKSFPLLKQYCGTSNYNSFTFFELNLFLNKKMIIPSFPLSRSLFKNKKKIAEKQQQVVIISKYINTNRRIKLFIFFLILIITIIIQQ